MQAFFAAGLGTTVYLLKITQENLKSREFDPAFIPAHLIRLWLGILIGGSIIILFPKSFFITDNDAIINQVQQQNLLAFIFGYTVEIFYILVDKIGEKLKKLF